MHFQFSYIKTKKKILLIIAGSDDGYTSILKNRIQNLNIEKNVLFTGYISETEKLEAYVDADVLVYPGRDEIFGLVQFESIICNTPIIVSNDSGCGEIIRKADCGFLINYGDIKELEEKINFVLLNPDSAQKKVIAGKEYIKNNLTWEIISSKIERVYLDCINNQNTSRKII